MDLKTFISDWTTNNVKDKEYQGFIIKGDKLYVKNKAMILFCIKDDKYLIMRFRNDVKKYIKKFFKVVSNQYKIILSTNSIGAKMKENDHYYSISNAFNFYVKGDFYDIFHNNKKDVFNMVVDYIDYYDCEESFYEIFGKEKIKSWRWSRYTYASINEAVRGLVIGFDIWTGDDKYLSPSQKYIDELSVENLERRYKIEKAFKSLDDI